jgi:hypothetical protein
MKHLPVLAMCVAVIALQGCGGKRRQPAPAEPRPAVASVPAAPVAEAPPADPAAEPRTPTHAEFEALMVMTVAFIVAMAGVATKSGDDCGVAAAGLEEVMIDNAALIAEASKYKDSTEVARMTEEWMAAHMNEFIEPASRLGEMAQRCAEDPAFNAAFEKYRVR